MHQHGFDSEALTWADLLMIRLRPVRSFVLYFPTRFDLDVDRVTEEALRTFGAQSGPEISVNFWDPTDPEFLRTLGLFDLKRPPALVLAAGLKPDVNGLADLSSLYMIAFTDAAMLRDRERLARGVNTAIELLERGDRGAIAGFLRQRSVASLISTVAAISTELRDAILALKPRLGLPGGLSLGLG